MYTLCFYYRKLKESIYRLLLTVIVMTNACLLGLQKKAVTKRSSNCDVVPASAHSRAMQEAQIVNSPPKNLAPAESLRTKVRRPREAAPTDVAPTINNMPLENPIPTERSRAAVRRRREIAVPEEAPVIKASLESYAWGLIE